MKNKEYIVLLPNIRSAHNVGSIFRTADALGIQKIYIAGYTPTPVDRFNRPQKEIQKTALGAEKTIPWEYVEDTTTALRRIKKEGFTIVAIEQDIQAIDYKKIKINKLDKVAFVVGNEVDGMSKSERKLCDYFVEIPMKGNKESLNVNISFAVALYRVLNV